MTAPQPTRWVNYGGDHRLSLGAWIVHPDHTAETVVSVEYDHESYITRLGFARGLHEVEGAAA